MYKFVVQCSRAYVTIVLYQTIPTKSRFNCNIRQLDYDLKAVNATNAFMRNSAASIISAILDTNAANALITLVGNLITERKVNVNPS